MENHNKGGMAKNQIDANYARTTGYIRHNLMLGLIGTELSIIAGKNADAGVVSSQDSDSVTFGMMSR
jgi:hypothetical protein